MNKGMKRSGMNEILVSDTEQELRAAQWKRLSHLAITIALAAFTAGAAFSHSDVLQLVDD